MAWGGGGPVLGFDRIGLSSASQAHAQLGRSWFCRRRRTPAHSNFACLRPVPPLSPCSGLRGVAFGTIGRPFSSYANSQFLAATFVRCQLVALAYVLVSVLWPTIFVLYKFQTRAAVLFSSLAHTPRIAIFSFSPGFSSIALPRSQKVWFRSRWPVSAYGSLVNPTLMERRTI